MAETRPTVHVRLVGARYHITIGGPNRAYAVQRMREHIPSHRRYYCGDGRWSTTEHWALVARLSTDRTVRVDWPETTQQSA